MPLAAEGNADITEEPEAINQFTGTVPIPGDEKSIETSEDNDGTVDIGTEIITTVENFGFTGTVIVDQESEVCEDCEDEIVELDGDVLFEPDEYNGDDE